MTLTIDLDLNRMHTRHHFKLRLHIPISLSFVNAVKRSKKLPTNMVVFTVYRIGHFCTSVIVDYCFNREEAQQPQL